MCNFSLYFIGAFQNYCSCSFHFFKVNGLNVTVGFIDRKKYLKWQLRIFDIEMWQP